MIRAHELFDCDMSDEAASEWNAALDGADNALKVQAALLATRWGWFAQSITTLAQTGEFDDVTLRYPRPFLEAVSGAAKIAQLPPDWILAVMRQESLFRKDAVSRADARGLMQMVPSTASAVARRWHLSSPGRDGLFDPSIAVPLGCRASPWTPMCGLKIFLTTRRAAMCSTLRSTSLPLRRCAVP